MTDQPRGWWWGGDRAGRGEGEKEGDRLAVGRGKRGRGMGLASEGGGLGWLVWLANEVILERGGLNIYHLSEALHVGNSRDQWLDSGGQLYSVAI